MKLIIQIPCFNEEDTLPETLADLPRAVEGFDTVEWLIVDDGSTDRTHEIALAHGVHHIVSHATNRGLARAFMTGLEASLKRGADVIVNTDADNQYRGADIPKLVQPILERSAEIVIGARPIGDIDEFTTAKKFLQRVGSAVVRFASATSVSDAPSGFRAFSKDAAIQLYVVGHYTYTLETLIQAGRKNISIASVDVGTNPKTRESRLIKSMPQYIWRSFITIVRIFVVYKPLKFFTFLAFLVGTPGVIAVFRFLYLYSIGEGSGNIQSLAIASTLISVGAILQMGGFLADIASVNRVLLEEVRARMLKAEVEKCDERAQSDELRAEFS